MPRLDAGCIVNKTTIYPYTISDFNPPVKIELSIPHKYCRIKLHDVKVCHEQPAPKRRPFSAQELFGNGTPRAVERQAKIAVRDCGIYLLDKRGNSRAGQIEPPHDAAERPEFDGKIFGIYARDFECVNRRPAPEIAAF